MELGSCVLMSHRKWVPRKRVRPVVILTAAVAVFAIGATVAVGRPAGHLSGRYTGLRAYRVPSQAMAPTLKAGETVYVGGRYTPHVGDVVVFAAPIGALGEQCGIKAGRGEMCAKPTPKETSTYWVKRVVAGPGDTIAMSAGRVILNGKPLPERYVNVSLCAHNPACTYPKAITVPRGYFYMLGDNRGGSDDSRFWGPVPLAWIVGRVETCSAAGTSCRYVS